MATPSLPIYDETYEAYLSEADTPAPADEGPVTAPTGNAATITTWSDAFAI